MTKKAEQRYQYLLKNQAYLNSEERDELALLADQLAEGQSDSGAQVASQPSRQSGFKVGNFLALVRTMRLNRDSSNQRQVRASNKGRLTKGKIALRIVLGLLALMLVGGFWGYYRGHKAVGNFKVAHFEGEKTASGAINILILGTDQRDFQNTADARSDSIMVLSINRKDNRVKLVSFMRDTLIDIPGVGTMGYDQSKLNTAYNIGEQNDHQGAELMRETLAYNFDLKIQYYAMVNFNSFATVIDSLFPMGVKIDAQFATVDGKSVSEVSVPDDLRRQADGTVPEQVIKVGKQRMDGRTLLNYARFRHDDENDYGRVKRQQQVMQAIFSQVKNPATLFTGPSALGTVLAVTATNMPQTSIFAKSVGVLMDASHGVESMTVPADQDWVEGYDMYGGLGIHIDYDKYRATLQGFLGN